MMDNAEEIGLIWLKKRLTKTLEIGKTLYWEQRFFPTDISQ